MEFWPYFIMATMALCLAYWNYIYEENLKFWVCVALSIFWIVRLHTVNT